ncbi:MAG: hypothetical protein ACK4ZO_07925 [Cyanobacteriota bacterium]|jgi:hypothetical protein
MASANNEWGRTFNNVASGLAALAGILAIVITSITSCQVRELSQQQDAAKLIGDLTKNLTDKKIGRDVSMLALEHTLNPDEKADTATQRKMLLARIATLLIEGSLNEESPDFSHGIDQATMVLQRLVETSGQQCKQYYDKLLDLKASMSAEEDTPANLLSQCGPAGQLAFSTLRQPIEGKTRAGEEATSPSQLAVVNSQDAEAAGLAVAQARVNTQLNELLIENRRKQNIHTQPSRAVLTIHVDKAPDQLQAIKEQLSKERWFVVAGIRVVPSDTRACGTYNSIRYFHRSDQNLAKELRQTLESFKKQWPTDKNIQTLLRGEGNTIPNIQISDLSKWTFAKHVPKASLELWLVRDGKRCASKTSSAGGTASLPITAGGDRAAGS